MVFNFNYHNELRGRHALLSPSSSSWLRYDREKLLQFKINSEAKKRGTRLHEWACESIKLGRIQPDKDALGLYINDAIANGLKPEQPLQYSDSIFGTADAIGFDGNTLRISDYKSGTVNVYEEKKKDFEQLLIYAALFCLEYAIDPNRIRTILKIYQIDKVIKYVPLPEEIAEITDIIMNHEETLSQIDKGGFI